MAFLKLTLAQIQRMAQAYLGDPVSSGRYGQLPKDPATGIATGEPAIITIWINGCQNAMSTPNLGVQDVTNLFTITGQRDYPLPDGFMTMKRVWYNGTVLRYVEMVDLDYFDQGNSYADRYTLWNGKVRLGSLPPDTPYSLKYQFYRTPNLLVNAGDISELPPQFHMALVYGAAAECLRADGQPAAAADMDRRFEREKAEFQSWVDHQTLAFTQVRNVTEGWTSYWGYGR